MTIYKHGKYRIADIYSLKYSYEIPGDYNSKLLREIKHPKITKGEIVFVDTNKYFVYKTRDEAFFHEYFRQQKKENLNYAQIVLGYKRIYTSLKYGKALESGEADELIRVKVKKPILNNKMWKIEHGKHKEKGLSMGYGCDYIGAFDKEILEEFGHV